MEQENIKKKGAITVRWDWDDFEEIRNLAYSNRMSASRLVRIAVRNLLDEVHKKAEEKRNNQQGW